MCRERGTVEVSDGLRPRQLERATPAGALQIVRGQCRALRAWPRRLFLLRFDRFRLPASSQCGMRNAELLGNDEWRMTNGDEP